MREKKIIGISLFILVVLIGGLLYLYNDSKKIGQEIDSYKGVPVYHNGILYTRSYGKNYSIDGYYYGLKWQCVEYIKRFYYDALSHKMPDVLGNAKDFYDENVSHGQLNKRRNLVQYKNRENVKPQEDDLIVFTDTMYGHVAIVTKVADDYIEVIQQNVFGKPRSRYTINCIDGKWYVGEARKPAGWLRKE